MEYIYIYIIYSQGEKPESLECGAAGKPGNSILYTGEKKIRVRRLRKGDLFYGGPTLACSIGGSIWYIIMSKLLPS